MIPWKHLSQQNYKRIADSECSSSALLRRALVGDFFVALSSFRTLSTFFMVIGITVST
jgi:hypothetical protein